jgi:hypothetical protein
MLCKILKDFPGAPDGHSVVEYKAGETVELPDDLAAGVVRDGLARPHIENKAIVSDGSHRETLTLRKK